MRISRGCYDKFHRCPGWAGGGVKGRKVNRCPSGSYVQWVRPWPKIPWLYYYQCPECDVVVLWLWTQKLDPTWWYHIWWRISVPVWFSNQRAMKRWRKQRKG